ncbi:MAG TPA: SDR family oxidoreductase [Streptosporangiaceae bacterium]|jgi:NAD(P)-dependent dehydrogenase (short-subunit alcohol dehydrogenase family)
MAAANGVGVSLPDLFDLSGRTALVTGASRGIGALAARALDDAGARVILCARDIGRLREAGQTLRNDPIAMRADLSDRQGVTSLLSDLAGYADHVDILINNAGTHAAGEAMELAPDVWDEVQNVNLRSAFLLARGLAPAMARRGWGKIVNMASVLGVVADVDASAYVASKAGLLGLTRALGTEWAGRGITVNALCPGWIDTDMVSDLRSRDSFDRRVLRRTPAGRWGRADDLTGALIFLSSHASDFMVGQTLIIDGGLTASW